MFQHTQIRVSDTLQIQCQMQPHLSVTSGRRERLLLLYCIDNKCHLILEECNAFLAHREEHSAYCTVMQNYACDSLN